MERDEIQFKSFIILAGIIGIILIIAIAIFICPGSYGNAKNYTFLTSDDSLMLAISSVKQEHPELNASLYSPFHDQKDTFLGTTEYHYYFYYPDEHIVLHTLSQSENFTIESTGKKVYKTTFIFAGTNKCRGCEWEPVCYWCGLIDKKDVVRKFEQNILNKIIQKLGKPAT